MKYFFIGLTANFFVTSALVILFGLLNISLTIMEVLMISTIFLLFSGAIWAYRYGDEYEST